MPKYRRPGIFYQTAPRAPFTIVAAATSTTAFIGPTRSPSASTKPTVRSWLEFESGYGGASLHDHPAVLAMRLAVYVYFLNGGQRAHIVPVDNAGNIASYTRALAELQPPAEVNILVLPGQAWDGGKGQAILQQAISHCEVAGDRMVILDLPQTTTLTTSAQINALHLSHSGLAASYYPWPAISNPLPGQTGLMPVSPAAFAAGVWSGTGTGEGVWKAPAGSGAQLHGVSTLPDTSDPALLEALTEQGINAIRELPRLGPVIWGARTLASNANPQWRYIAVRRSALFIEQSVARAMERMEFEANDQNLWTALKQACESFLANLYRSGAFQGSSPRHAYYVRCGLGESMTQADLDLERLTLELGIALLKPAEFTLLRITQQLRHR